jgi:YopX protein
MREIIFKYVIKNKHTGVIYYKVYSLEQIEENGLKGLFDIENYDIIARLQYTGLNDKNKIRIFENDKVNHWQYGECIVIWNRFSCSFQLHPFPHTELISTEMFSHVDEYTFEVIGNVHDKK